MYSDVLQGGGTVLPKSWKIGLFLEAAYTHLDSGIRAVSHGMSLKESFTRELE